MKFLLFPTARHAIAHVASGSESDVSLYARHRQCGTAPTSEEAIEDIELRREGGVMQVRSRAIGTEAWGAWASVEEKAK